MIEQSTIIETFDYKDYAPPPFNYLLLKLAAQCNIRCTYCYWFRDSSVLRKPKLLTEEAESALLQKLRAHIREHGVKSFHVLFHGGEPLLFGLRRFRALCKSLRSLESESQCVFRLSITTNAILVTAEWAEAFREYEVAVTVSIDGPREIHDGRRIDFRGQGTYDRVISGLRHLNNIGIRTGVLSVCDPASDPVVHARHFVENLELRQFDILIPDDTHDDNPSSIKDFYVELFDYWYKVLAPKGIKIRLLRSMLKGLLGGDSGVESIGYGPVQTLTMLTDGSLEPLDVLRISGEKSTATSTNIFDHEIQSVTSDPVWQSAFIASLNLPHKCQICRYSKTCGGGFLPNRFSKSKGYDNPSVYCEDIMVILDHISNAVVDDLSLVTESGHHSFKSLLSTRSSEQVETQQPLSAALFT